MAVYFARAETTDGVAPLRTLDLFSGIGGFSLGLERTGGFKTVAFCEIEDFPRRVLAKHWPDVPIHRDVRKLKGSDVGAVDVICGGFPCQPFSSAGQRRGTGDDRWLWPEMRRLIQELRPRWVIGENVTHIDRMGLEIVLSDLEADAYEIAPPLEIPACAVDLGHIRFRTWLVGHSNHEGKPGFAVDDEMARLPANDADTQRGHIALGRYSPGAGRPGQSVPGHAIGHAQDHARRVGSNDGLPSKLDGVVDAEEHRKATRADRCADTDRVSGVRGDGRPDATSSKLRGTGSLRGSVRPMSHHGGPEGRTSGGEAAEGVQGLRPVVHADAQQEPLDVQPRVPFSHWPHERGEALGQEPNVAHGVKNRMDRLRGLGNAVVPQIPELIGRAILAAEAA